MWVQFGAVAEIKARVSKWCSELQLHTITSLKQRNDMQLQLIASFTNPGFNCTNIFS
jgi:hypothetical protein